MLQNHERDQVAGLAGIAAEIDPLLKTGEVRSRVHVKPVRMFRVLAPYISHVTLRAMSSRDVPAAPPLFQRTIVTRQERPCLQERDSLTIRIHRSDQMAGDSKRLWRGVALQALLSPNKLGGVTLLLVERVEDGSAVRVHRRHLDHITPSHPPHVDIVIEIEGPRRRGRDAVLLKARL